MNKELCVKLVMYKNVYYLKISLKKSVPSYWKINF